MMMKMTMLTYKKINNTLHNPSIIINIKQQKVTTITHNDNIQTQKIHTLSNHSPQRNRLIVLIHSVLHLQQKIP